MANIRCFDSSKPNLTASELSREKKKQIIYNEIRQNVQQFNTANPMKLNGNEYNSQTIINTTCDISFGSLEYAESYAVLDDVREGAGLCNPVIITTPITTVQYAACSNICSDTFANGFQDTGQTGELAVYDASANEYLQNLDTNANLTTSVIIITTLTYAASEFTTQTLSLGTGALRFRNATFLGSCDATAPNNDPMFVIQYSTDNSTWFSDGIEPSFFQITPTSWQFCFQRSNVPTRYIRLFFVNATTFTSLQLVLTKN
jgi:hypothetical protein